MPSVAVTGLLNAETQNSTSCWPHPSEVSVRTTEIVDAFADDPLGMLRENANLLMHMSVETGLPYMTPSLAAIRKMAKDFGGAAKPSGAGGGDCAVALFPDEGAKRAFISAITARGRTVIPVSVAGPAALLG